MCSCNMNSHHHHTSPIQIPFCPTSPSLISPPHNPTISPPTYSSIDLVTPFGGSLSFPNSVKSDTSSLTSPSSFTTSASSSSSSISAPVRRSLSTESYRSPLSTSCCSPPTNASRIGPIKGLGSPQQDKDKKKTWRQPARSCEPCRKKKTKCDRKMPCGSCVFRKGACDWSGVARPIAAESLSPTSDSGDIEINRLRTIVTSLANLLQIDPEPLLVSRDAHSSPSLTSASISDSPALTSAQAPSDHVGLPLELPPAPFAPLPVVIDPFPKPEFSNGSTIKSAQAEMSNSSMTESMLANVGQDATLISWLHSTSWDHGGAEQNLLDGFVYPGTASGLWSM